MNTELAMALVHALVDGLLVCVLAGLGGLVARHHPRVALLLGGAALVRLASLAADAGLQLLGQAFWTWASASTWRSLLPSLFRGISDTALLSLLFASVFVGWDPPPQPAGPSGGLDDRATLLLRLFGIAALVNAAQHAWEITDDWHARSWVMGYMDNPSGLPSGDVLLPFATPLEVLGFGAVALLGAWCVLGPAGRKRQGVGALVGMTWAIAAATSLIYFVRFSGPFDKIVGGWLLENVGGIGMTIVLGVLATTLPRDP